MESNTLVLFTSDNGPWLTQKSSGGVAIWPILSGQAIKSSRQVRYYFHGTRREADLGLNAPLLFNGRKVAQAKANSWWPVQPGENFGVGFDDKQPVGDYGNPHRFVGKIENLKVSTEGKP